MKILQQEKCYKKPIEIFTNFEYQKKYLKNLSINSLQPTKLVLTLKISIMIVVHEIFVCKPGNASKLATMFKEVMADSPEFVNIMTDMTGEFNRVIMQSQYDNLTAYEERFKNYIEDSEEVKKMKEKMKGYHDLYLTGKREIFKVW